MFTTVEDIAEDVVKNLPLEDREEILGISDRNGIIALHFGLGMGIRNDYGLWRSGNPLTKWKDPDDISQEILMRVWDLVHASCPARE